MLKVLAIPASTPQPEPNRGAAAETKLSFEKVLDGETAQSRESDRNGERVRGKDRSFHGNKPAKKPDVRKKSIEEAAPCDDMSAEETAESSVGLNVLFMSIFLSEVQINTDPAPVQTSEDDGASEIASSGGNPADNQPAAWFTFGTPPPLFGMSVPAEKAIPANGTGGQAFFKADAAATENTAAQVNSKPPAVEAPRETLQQDISETIRQDIPETQKDIPETVREAAFINQTLSSPDEKTQDPARPDNKIGELSVSRDRNPHQFSFTVHSVVNKNAGGSAGQTANAGYNAGETETFSGEQTPETETPRFTAALNTADTADRDTALRDMPRFIVRENGAEFSNIQTKTNMPIMTMGMNPPGVYSGKESELTTTVFGGQTVGRIADNIAVMKKANTPRFTMQLFPESLGKVTVDIVSGARGLELKIHAGNNEVSTALNSRLDQLREALAARQVEVISIDVGTSVPADTAYNGFNFSGGGQSADSKDAQRFRRSPPPRYNAANDDDNNSETLLFRQNQLLDYIV